MGGEEFALLLPDADATEGRMVAERLRQAVRNLKMPHESGVGQQLSISIGGGVLLPEGDLSPTDLLAQGRPGALSREKRGPERHWFSPPTCHWFIASLPSRLCLT